MKEVVFRGDMFSISLEFLLLGSVLEYPAVLVERRTWPGGCKSITGIKLHQLYEAV